MMTDDLDEVERRVREALVAVDAAWRDIPDSDAAWTRAIKHAVGGIGEQLGYLVCAAESRFADNGEWLYDLTWLKVDDSKRIVLDIPLALESEWTPDDELMFDFQKLVVSKAQHRVMLFWAESDASADQILTVFIDQVRRFHGSRVGDRYLFAFYVGNDRPLQFKPYVHG